MEYAKTPFYQKVIRRLPFSEKISRMLGVLFGGNIKAVVNQVRMSLDLQEGIQRKMFLGIYEPTQTEWFKECVSVGDIFIDIGASFGHYTTLGAATVGPSGKVFAFEPSPLASEAIKYAIKESKLQNVFLVQSAVGKSDCMVELFLPTTKNFYSPSIMKSDPSFCSYQIPVITLDGFSPLKNISAIKLIKIDVEGYEPDVLQGMTNILREGRVQNIFCEFNSWWLERNLTTSEELLDRFLQYGYVIHKKTKLQRDLVGHKGVSYNLQDIWFKYHTLN